MPGQCKIAGALLSALVVVALYGSAMAQTYPTRAVTIITPWLPGGGIDITARQVAAELQNALGQAFVVENKAGASGNIATADVARAAPDGYTLLLTISGFQTTNPALFKSLPWDPIATSRQSRWCRDHLRSLSSIRTLRQRHSLT